MFTPKIGEDEPMFDLRLFFKMGWWKTTNQFSYKKQMFHPQKIIMDGMVWVIKPYGKIGIFSIRGFPKMVGFPNKPMGCPTKNDQHLGVCFGGTTI